MANNNSIKNEIKIDVKNDFKNDKTNNNNDNTSNNATEKNSKPKKINYQNMTFFSPLPTSYLSRNEGKINNKDEICLNDMNFFWIKVFRFL